MSRKSNSQKMFAKVSGCGELRESVRERLERVRKAFADAASAQAKLRAMQKLQGREV